MQHLEELYECVWSRERAKLNVGDIVYFSIVHNGNIQNEYLGQIAHIEIQGRTILGPQIWIPFEKNRAPGVPWPKNLPPRQAQRDFSLKKLDSVVEIDATFCEVSLAIAPEGTCIEFPFDANHCPHEYRPIQGRLTDEAGEFVTFRIPCQHLTVLHNFAERDMSDIYFYKQKTLTRLCNEKQCIITEDKSEDWDMFCAITYRSYWRTIFSVESYEYEGYYRKLKAMATIHSHEQIGGQLNPMEYYDKFSPGQKLAHKYLISRLAMDSSRTMDQPPCIINADMQTTYRTMLKCILLEMNLTRDVVKVVKNTKDDKRYMFTKENRYCEIGLRAACAINFQLKHTFLRLESLEWADRGCKAGDVLYGYEVMYTPPRSDKEKTKFLWMVADENGDRMSYETYQIANAIAKLDTFIQFVTTDGHHKMFKGKAPDEIVEMCRPFKDATPLSDLIEGWFNVEADNKTVQFFKKMYLWWM